MSKNRRALKNPITLNHQAYSRTPLEVSEDCDDLFEEIGAFAEIDALKRKAMAEAFISSRIDSIEHLVLNYFLKPLIDHHLKSERAIKDFGEYKGQEIAYQAYQMASGFMARRDSFLDAMYSDESNEER